MDTKQVLAALAALAQESRLAVFRLLVQAGPEGLAASRIARARKHHSWSTWSIKSSSHMPPTAVKAARGITMPDEMIVGTDSTPNRAAAWGRSARAVVSDLLARPLKAEQEARAEQEGGA